MIKKVCHWIFGLCMVAGLILAVGVTDTSGLNDMEWINKIYLGILAIALMFIGVIGLRSSGWKHLN